MLGFSLITLEMAVKFSKGALLWKRSTVPKGRREMYSKKRASCDRGMREGGIDLRRGDTAQE